MSVNSYDFCLLLRIFVYFLGFIFYCSDFCLLLKIYLLLFRLSVDFLGTKYGVSYREEYYVPAIPAGGRRRRQRRRPKNSKISSSPQSHQ